MAAGRPKRIEQTRSATPMDTDGAVAPVELLQDVAVGGQGQNPRAHKRVRRRRPRTDDRKQPLRGRRAGLADHDRYAPHQTSAAIDRERPICGRHDDPPSVRTQDHLGSVDPSGGVVGPRGKADLYPASSAGGAGRIEDQQPRRLRRPDEGPGPRARSRDTTMNTRPSKQLRAPRQLVRGSTDDRTGRTAPVAQESGRRRRRPDDPDQDTHEHRRPAHRLKSGHNMRRPPMARPARRMRHSSITRARAATRIVRSRPYAQAPCCHRRHCRSPAPGRSAGEVATLLLVANVGVAPSGWLGVDAIVAPDAGPGGWSSPDPRQLSKLAAR